MGLATKLVSRVLSTSPRPCGTTSDWAASARTTDTGNTKLVTEAMAAARKVVSIYSQMTVPKRRSSLELPCASALATITNTSTGAMPFSAPTNRLPSSPTQPAPGTASASTAPMTRPATMRRMRLTSLYFFATAFTPFIISKHSSICVRTPRTLFCLFPKDKCYYSTHGRKVKGFPQIFRAVPSDFSLFLPAPPAKLCLCRIQS